MTVGKSALDPAMQAFIAKLAADATYVALCTGGTYDAVPLSATYPYAWVTIRENPEPMETFARMGQEIEWRLQIYCRDDVYEGTKVIDQILARAVVVLHHGVLTLTGWNTPQVQYDGAFPMPLLEDKDGQVVRTKVAIFRGFAEAA